MIAEARRLVARRRGRDHAPGPERQRLSRRRARTGRPGASARLIRALAEIEGLERIRYTTSHPRDLDAALIAAHGEVPQLMPFLHLPVQSGSDRILAAMNRQHRAEDYLDRSRRCAARGPTSRSPPISSSAFPARARRDFEATLALVEAVGFAQAYSFKYSARPGTPAGGAARDQVPEEVKADRLSGCRRCSRASRRRSTAACSGALVPVLFERPGPPSGPAGRPHALAAGRACRRPRPASSGASPRPRSRLSGRTASPAGFREQGIRQPAAAVHEARMGH